MSEYSLHSYFRSSCSARLRIALNLKSIPYNLVPVNLLKNEHLSESHVKLNPSSSVPLLVSPNGDFKIGQSVAALEYLEEVHTDRPLLPPLSDPESRAKVRALANVIVSDIQPVTNMRVMRRLREFNVNAEDWNKEFMGTGLKAYEALAKESAGKYSVGDQITLADVCLLPAVWNAQRFGVDLSGFPTVTRIVEGLEGEEAVVNAHYFNQPDTPDDLRKK